MDVDDAIWDEVGMSDEAFESLLSGAAAVTEYSHSPPGVIGHNTGKVSVPEIALSPEQNAILELVKAGKSLFFTGSAGTSPYISAYSAYSLGRPSKGTGKSVLLRAIISYFRDKYKPDPPPTQHEWEEEPMTKLAITAATGIASVNIDGCTLHSWAGVGLGKEDARDLVVRFRAADRRAKSELLLEPDPHRRPRKVTTVDRWQEVETLIIDESEQVLSANHGSENADEICLQSR